MDELTLLARNAGRGDRTALTTLIRATQGDVWRVCAHLVDPATADDLAQETYLRAIPALRQFRGDSSVRTWLLTIARRVCAHEIKTRQRDRRIWAKMGSEATETSVRAEITELLATLEPDRRAAFVLTQMIGCSYAQAAEICGCPIGTIRSRVARARADLDAIVSSGATAAEGTV